MKKHKQIKISSMERYARQFYKYFTFFVVLYKWKTQIEQYLVNNMKIA